MKPVSVLLLVVFMAGVWPARARQSSQTPQEQERIRQQQEAAARAAEEARRKQEEEQRNQFLKEITANGPVNLSKAVPPLSTEPCVSRTMRQDFAFDLKEIPVAEWLASGESEQIPWKVQIGKPQLRIDQRYELASSVSVQGKDLKWSDRAQELLYISGVNSPDGQSVVRPRTGSQTFNQLPPAEFRVGFSDCVFLQPGEYVLWLAIYDRNSSHHSLTKRRIRAAEFSSDPLPKLNAELPAVEFPKVTGGGQKPLLAIPGPVVLPISNKRPLNVKLVSIWNPADQWTNRSDIVRWSDNRVLAATGILSQMRIGNGSLSSVAMNLINRTTPFQQPDVRQLNLPALLDTVPLQSENHKVTVPILQTLKERSAFLRQWLRDRLEAPGQPMRVFIFLSGSLSFERGSDLTPLKWEGDCNCRVYLLRFRLSKDDVFDDLEKIVKPLRPRAFNVTSGLEFRRALGEIVEELEGL